MEGYVYVLINPAIPGLVKIGRTTNTPSDRAADLSTTGVPERFVEAHSVFANDCIALELKLHEYFASNRYSPKREFFRITVEEAIKAFYLFTEFWTPRSSNRVKVCLYAYLLAGPYHHPSGSTTRDEIKRHKDTLGDFSLDHGIIRIGCIEDEERQISGDNFTLNMKTREYLDSIEFRDLLADYYKKLVGRPVLLNPCSGLIHSKLFEIRQNFFESFSDTVKKLFNDGEDYEKCFDKQTFRAQKGSVGVYELMLNYEHLVLEFDFEESESATEEVFKNYDAEVSSNYEKVREFKGKL